MQPASGLFSWLHLPYLGVGEVMAALVVTPSSIDAGFDRSRRPAAFSLRVDRFDCGSIGLKTSLLQTYALFFLRVMCCLPRGGKVRESQFRCKKCFCCCHCRRSRSCHCRCRSY